jgi:hypothetical protein
MARLNVRPPPGPSCKIATKITPPCPPASRLYVLGSANQIVVSRSGRSGPIMAQSNVRPTQEASRKKQPLAKSPLWVFVRPVPIYLIFGPHLCQPSTFSPSMASVRTHQKQNCSHFLYSIQPSVSLTISLSCPNPCSISSISNARNYPLPCPLGPVCFKEQGPAAAL